MMTVVEVAVMEHSIFYVSIIITAFSNSKMT